MPMFTLFLFFFLHISYAKNNTDCASNILIPPSCSTSSNDFMKQLYISCKIFDSGEWFSTCRTINCLKGYDNIYLNIRGNGQLVFSDHECTPMISGLDLSYAPSLQLFSSMFQETGLTSYLNLSHSTIMNVADGAFTGLEKLQLLDLSHNNIKEILSRSLNGLKYLKSLDLSYNEIKSIHVEALSHLQDLEVLRIDHNKLITITADHFPSSGSLRTLSLQSNQISTFLVAINDTSFSSLQNLSSLDISSNLIECSCVLKETFKALPALRSKVVNTEATNCYSPTKLMGRMVHNMTFFELACEAPQQLISYPSREQLIRVTDSIDLECRVSVGFPKPQIIWVTPRGSKFYSESATLLMSKQDPTFDLHDGGHTYGRYEEENVFLMSEIQLLPDDKLRISKFRGDLSGSYTCIALNYEGNITHVINLKALSFFPRHYTESLFIGAMTSVAALMAGFLIGAIKSTVVKCRNKHFFTVPVFSKPPSEAPAEGLNKPASFADQCSFGDCAISEKTPSLSPECPSPSKMDDKLEDEDYTSEDQQANRNSLHILGTIEEAHDRLRSGVGRKIERVRKNVQSFKESGSSYVHSIKETSSSAAKSLKETSSSAAKSMKAGVVLGVETVKFHAQSFKELCGTGNMGTQTLSVVSVETDVDTSEKKEVVRQVTII